MGASIMPPLDFPDSPFLTQDFRAGDVTWVWNGVFWRFKSMSNIATPFIDFITPTAVGLSDTVTTITVTGSGFDTTTMAFIGAYDPVTTRPNLRPRSTTFISPNEVSFEVTGTDYTQPELLYVTVRNGTVNAPPPLTELKVITNPTITNITPDDESTDLTNSTFVLTVDGTGFTGDPACPTQLLYDGVVISHDPTFTATQLTATVPREVNAKIVQINLRDGTVPSTSPDLPLEFVELPRITSNGIRPERCDNIVTLQILQIAGSGFTENTVILIDNVEQTTTYASAGMLECTVTPNTMASGIRQIAARTKIYTSGNEPWTIDIVAPTVISISPTSVVQDSDPYTLTITGTNFTHETDITVDGIVQATTLVSPTQVTCAMPVPVLDGPLSALVNVKTMTVAATTADFTINYPNPRPVFTSMTPNRAKPNVSDPNWPFIYIDIAGSNFDNTCVVKMAENESNMDATTYVSATALDFKMHMVPREYEQVPTYIQKGAYRSTATLNFEVYS
jgi:hypothetical protein